ncbi:GPI8 [[Candida] subhashii]|uniref:GPI8 n=1 Tax=[Candida] subhashii TaxID=561895 RepID=A0A8J5QHW2_9ASCO|nr:GPI8 [[Candida] subhashii]KAG7662334.1 GPI8 [[Candida] subhashii]
MVNLERFHEFMQNKISNKTPSIKRNAVNNVRKPLMRKAINSPNPSTPNLKRRKVAEQGTPDYNTPPLTGISESSPAEFVSANNTFEGSSPIKAKSKESNILLESLNPAIEEIETSLDENEGKKQIRLASNFDASKFKFRTMQMKLLESADVLDDQIDHFTSLYQQSNKQSDVQFGNPCLSSQFEILCCGRIVPDSPLYDKENLSLNSTSLYLETSRISGIGQRVPLDISKIAAYSFFPGQIVILKGRNPSGKTFIAHEVLDLPQLGSPVSSADEIKQVQELQGENECNQAVQDGEYVFPNDKPQPRNLDEVFKTVITPILKKIDNRIQVILYPSLKDSCIKHCSYPQEGFDRKKFGLPKNIKVFPNPSSFSVNEVLIGNSNLDVFKDLRDVSKEDDSKLVYKNRFDRIVKHILDQRRYYPCFPGSVKTVPAAASNTYEMTNGGMGENLVETGIGGSCLEVPYLGLTELGDSLPDVLILPSELKYFAKVIKGVTVINPGLFIKPIVDLPRSQPTQPNQENILSKVEGTSSVIQQNDSTATVEAVTSSESVQPLHGPRYFNAPIVLLAISSILDSIDEGIRRPAVAMATGSGKTVVFSHLIPLLKPSSETRGNKTLVLAHTQELIHQSYKTVKKVNPDLKVEIEMGKLAASKDADVVIASVQSLARGDRLSRYDPNDYKAIIVDECHHAVASSWQKIFEHFGATTEESEVYLIGFTATLERDDNAALNAAFDFIVFERSLSNMIQDNHLVDFKISEVEFPGMTGGDSELSEIDFIFSKECNTMIAMTYLKAQEKHQFRSTLVFCMNIAHCRTLCGILQEMGVNAQYVTGYTSKIEREAIVEDFKQGNIPVLCNVKVFTEGTDLPNVDCIILACRTSSNPLKVQMVGRGLRRHAGKSHCHIIDLAGLTRGGLESEPTLYGSASQRKKSGLSLEEERRKEEEERTIMEIKAAVDAGKMFLDKNLRDTKMVEHTRDGLTSMEFVDARWFKNDQAVDAFFRTMPHRWVKLEKNVWGVPGADFNSGYFAKMERLSEEGKDVFQISIHKLKSREEISRLGFNVKRTVLVKMICKHPNLYRLYYEFKKSCNDECEFAMKRKYKHEYRPTEKQVNFLKWIARARIQKYIKDNNITAKDPFIDCLAMEIGQRSQVEMSNLIFAINYSINSIYAQAKLNSIFRSTEARLDNGLITQSPGRELSKRGIPVFTKDRAPAFTTSMSEQESHKHNNENESHHTNNWAVLVSTSRFWFNYRHMANVLSLYRTVKRLGIPDSQIILMLSDDIACNARNAFPGTVFNNMDQAIDLYGDAIEVDYRGYEVTVENFIRLLTDRWDSDQPRSKRLLTDENSNIFIYMTGHGGNEFLKFQDAEEIGAYDIADAFAQMHEKKRYNEIFFMIDTCQANTMYEKIYSPNILAVGSSAFDESSYSHHSDLDIGVAVIDRFTYYTLDFLENISKDSKETMDKLFEVYTYENVHSHPGIRTELFKRNISEVLLTDFFGNIQKVIVDNVESDLLLSSINNSSKDNINPPTTIKKGGKVEFSFDSDENSTRAIEVTKSQAKMFGGLTVFIMTALWFIATKL